VHRLFFLIIQSIMRRQIYEFKVVAKVIGWSKLNVIALGTLYVIQFYFLGHSAAWITLNTPLVWSEQLCNPESRIEQAHGRSSINVTHGVVYHVETTSNLIKANSWLRTVFSSYRTQFYVVILYSELTSMVISH